MELKEVTGETVAAMLREIKEVSFLKDPYNFKLRECQSWLELLEDNFRNFRASIQRFWERSPLFKDEVLFVPDVSEISR